MGELSVPRLVRPALTPLGLYLRVGYNDHREIAAAIVSGRTQFSGVVVDAHRIDRHRELLDLVEKAGLECILDPCTQASAMPGGYSDALGELPWGAGHRHRPADFEASRLLPVVTSIAQFAVQHRLTEVISPTHYLAAANDPWLKIDIAATRAMRTQLDRSGGKGIGLIYLLTITYAMLRDESVVSELVDKLQGVPIDALWLRIDPFGDHSTGAAVRHFLDGSSEFHRIGAPIVADQVGGLVGLALTSTSAVAGISHGVTLRERFGGSAWKNPSDGKGFMLPHRVYLPSLDIYLDTREARRIFDSSLTLKSHFACSDPRCCPRGAIDMLESPGLHFLNQRMNQLAALSQVPESLRPQEFLVRYVRPTADAAVRFGQSKSLGDALRERIGRQRKRLDLLRVALEDLIGSPRLRSSSAGAETRAVREHRMSR